MRALVLTLTLLTACFGDTIEHDLVDGGVDSDVGSNGMAKLEASPRDTHLEYVVIAASLVIVLGPVASRRRRRGDSSETPPFS
jgi:hypothetical protein